MKRRTSMIIGLLLVLISSEPVFAQNDQPHTKPEACKADFEHRLGYEQRLYRSVIFGAPAINLVEDGSVLYDKNGNIWMKISDDTWQSPDMPDETWTDSIMDDEREIEQRFGILETRKALSSELIPPTLQAMRALQCRLRATCMATTESREKEPGDTLNIQPPGCIEFEMPVFEGCIGLDSVLITNLACDDAADMMIDREIRMMEMIIGYDAAYRSLIQFAGIFEGFLTDFQFPLLQPLWQMVRAAGALDGLPCFLAECNE